MPFGGKVAFSIYIYIYMYAYTHIYIGQVVISFLGSKQATSFTKAEVCHTSTEIELNNLTSFLSQSSFDSSFLFSGAIEVNNPNTS